MASPANLHFVFRHHTICRPWRGHLPQWLGGCESMMSAACRSALAIRSRSLIFWSSSTSSAANSRQSWTDKGAYDATARKLASLFNKNFETYSAGVSAEVKAAAPKA